MTKFRISAHNIYVERGRYENPPVPREDRWCTFCFMTYGQKPIEDEEHVLLHCPLYDFIRIKRLPSELRSPTKILDMISDTNERSCKNETLVTAKLLHEILETNQTYTAYYNNQDFHNNTGNCAIL